MFRRMGTVVSGETSDCSFGAFASGPRPPLPPVSPLFSTAAAVPEASTSAAPNVHAACVRRIVIPIEGSTPKFHVCKVAAIGGPASYRPMFPG